MSSKHTRKCLFEKLCKRTAKSKYALDEPVDLTKGNMYMCVYKNFN